MPLTVQQLIERLQEYPPHRIVATQDNDGVHRAPVLAGEVAEIDLDDGDRAPVVVIR